MKFSYGVNGRENLGKLYVQTLRAANSSGWIISKFKPIQAFMHVTVTYKKDEYQIKTESARVATTFLPL